VEGAPIDPSAAQQVAEYISGTWKSQAIHAAAALGIADLLSQQALSVRELSETLGCHAPSLQRLLRALSTLGIFEEASPGVYRSTSLGRCLENGAMRDAYLMMHSDWHDAAWKQLIHCIRTGESGFEKAHGTGLFAWLSGQPEASQLFSRAMTAGRAYREVGIAEAYEFSNANLVVDVGGGHGSLLVSILRAHAHMRGILCDLPDVAAIASAQIASVGMQDRCSAIGIDFFAGVPAGGDVYLLAHVVHDWPDDVARKILENCAAVMAPNGRILLVENILPGDNSPSRTHWLDLEMLVMTSGGRERTQRDFSDLLSSSGLEFVRVIPTPGSRTIIEAKKMARRTSKTVEG
jgi:SAM-dependent methyltransferase